MKVVWDLPATQGISSWTISCDRGQRPFPVILLRETTCWSVQRNNSSFIYFHLPFQFLFDLQDSNFSSELCCNLTRESYSWCKNISNITPPRINRTSSLNQWLNHHLIFLWHHLLLIWQGRFAQHFWSTLRMFWRFKDKTYGNICPITKFLRSLCLFGIQRKMRCVTLSAIVTSPNPRAISRTFKFTNTCWPQIVR